MAVAWILCQLGAHERASEVLARILCCDMASGRAHTWASRSLTLALSASVPACSSCLLAQAASLSALAFFSASSVSPFSFCVTASQMYTHHHVTLKSRSGNLLDAPEGFNSIAAQDGRLTILLTEALPSAAEEGLDSH